jgi:hypothetical protein
LTTVVAAGRRDDGYRDFWGGTGLLRWCYYIVDRVVEGFVDVFSQVYFLLVPLGGVAEIEEPQTLSRVWPGEIGAALDEEFAEKVEQRDLWVELLQPQELPHFVDFNEDIPALRCDNHVDATEDQSEAVEKRPATPVYLGWKRRRLYSQRIKGQPPVEAAGGDLLGEKPGDDEVAPNVGEAQLVGLADLALKNARSEAHDVVVWEVFEVDLAGGGQRDAILLDPLCRGESLVDDLASVLAQKVADALRVIAAKGRGNGQANRQGLSQLNELGGAFVAPERVDPESVGSHQLPETAGEGPALAPGDVTVAGMHILWQDRIEDRTPVPDHVERLSGSDVESWPRDLPAHPGLVGKRQRCLLPGGKIGALLDLSSRGNFELSL